MTHQEVIELLPWYVNATLSEDERRELDSHLAGCASCRVELDELTVLQRAIEESAEELPEPSRSRLTEAMAEIGAYEQAKQRPPVKSSSRLSEFLERIGEVLMGWCGPLPARAMVAAQFVLIVALAGGLGFSLWNQREFSTLSGHQVSEDDGARIAVRFEASITEAQLRDVVGEIKGTIVAGPSPLGIYTIRVPIAAENTAELDKLLERLRSKRQIIAYAERME